MKYLFEYLVVFIVCATAGWLLEVVYRSYNAKKLINPGFLTGCCLPIYGCGGLALYAISSLKLSYITSPTLHTVVIILAGTVIMTLIELVSGLFLLKYYHTRLWDYTDIKGNFKGVICPIFSVCWGVCCAVFYFFAYSPLKAVATAAVSKVGFIFLIGTYYGVFAVDLAASLDLMAKIREQAKRLKEIISVEELKLAAREHFIDKLPKPKSAYMFRLNTAIKQYMNEHKSDVEQWKKEIQEYRDKITMRKK